MPSSNETETNNQKIIDEIAGVLLLLTEEEREEVLQRVLREIGSTLTVFQVKALILEHDDPEFKID